MSGFVGINYSMTGTPSSKGLVDAFSVCPKILGSSGDLQMMVLLKNECSLSCCGSGKTQNLLVVKNLVGSAKRFANNLGKPPLPNIYRPQRSCEGYVFTGVCLSTGGRCLPQCMLGYHTPLSRPPWEQTPQEQPHPLPWSRHSPEQTPPRSRHPPTRASPRSRHPPLQQTPPSPREMATAADGTHPTGMHSCLKWFLRIQFHL